MDWAAKLLGVSPSFTHDSSGTSGGVIQSDASESAHDRYRDRTTQSPNLRT
ncbi:hypothetical protein ARMGADRAFT_1096495 [Armillaria gallica]|uniref:Uncharacterized protein n=1 Tax=Armillaria gallica TaxID=47427 RepID=A0A2H3EA06_ARMGA|nr:hypothetical protein ARMGADRAFT_1096495 [Armillaria gallica]